MVIDKQSGLSQGYGYVKFDDQTQAEAAVQAFNGHSIQAEQERRTISVKWASRRLRTGDQVSIANTQEQPGWVQKKKANKERAAHVPNVGNSEWDPRRVVVIKLLSRPSDVDENDEAESDDSLKKSLYKRAKKLLSTMPGLAEDVKIEVAIISAETTDSFTTGTCSP